MNSFLIQEKQIAVRAIKIIEILRQATKGMPESMSSIIVNNYGRDPFLILIGCLLSLRARDIVTTPICIELFKKAKTPKEILKIPIKELEILFHSIGFYKKKAKLVHDVSKEIIERFNNKVPSTKEELLSISGVGPKTANLVLAEGFNIPAICVDTHVHRISNRLGLVKTKTPEQTEIALQKVLPKEHWSEWNKLMVMWGQNICVPISPFCSKCAIYNLCPRIGVKSQR